MIRLIAMDLDGSLLSDDKKLPSDFWQVANALLDRGIAIVVASGRPLYNITHLFKRLENRLFFVCDNGTYAIHQHEELLLNELPKASVKEFVEVARQLRQVYPVLSGKEMSYVENTDKPFLENSIKYYYKYKVLDDLSQLDEPVLKISFCDLQGAAHNSFPHYRKFEKDFAVTLGGEWWVDITAHGGTKGKALEVIQKKLDVRKEETMAFGDYLNDLGMLERAGESYALKNAHAVVLKAARHETEADNNHSGITTELRKIFSI